MILLNPYRFAVAGGNEYLRIQITANNGDTYYCIQELELRLTAAGADQTTTTTSITATSTLAGYPASLMLDNNTTNDQNVWVSAATPGTVDVVIYLPGFDMATLQEVAIMPQNNAGVGPARAPKDFTIATGPTSGGAWTVVKTVTNSTGWTAGVYRTFAIP